MDRRWEERSDINIIEVVRKARGCKHYRRGCELVAPCCNKVYTCRFCHDANESHELPRKEVKEVICICCDTRQPVQATCGNCRVGFGNWTCLKCNLFDDENKGQYHCDGCGICRTGGQNRVFHCAKCNFCLPIELQNRHKCLENASRDNCPVCLENIHTSQLRCHIPSCGHLLHSNCYRDLLYSGNYACPTCQVSLQDMTRLWRSLDDEVERTPMPAEYQDTMLDILCNDCQEKSKIKFHVVGLKCAACGSYNTCRMRVASTYSADDSAVDLLNH